MWGAPGAAQRLAATCRSHRGGTVAGRGPPVREGCLKGARDAPNSPFVRLGSPARPLDGGGAESSADFERSLRGLQGVWPRAPTGPESRAMAAARTHSAAHGLTGVAAHSLLAEKCNEIQRSSYRLLCELIMWPRGVVFRLGRPRPGTSRGV